MSRSREDIDHAPGYCSLKSLRLVLLVDYRIGVTGKDSDRTRQSRIVIRHPNGIGDHVRGVLGSCPDLRRPQHEPDRKMIVEPLRHSLG